MQRHANLKLGSVVPLSRPRVLGGAEDMSCTTGTPAETNDSNGVFHDLE